MHHFKWKFPKFPGRGTAPSPRPLYHREGRGRGHPLSGPNPLFSDAYTDCIVIAGRSSAGGVKQVIGGETSYCLALCINISKTVGHIPQLQLMTDTELHVCFRSVPRSMTPCCIFVLKYIYSFKHIKSTCTVHRQYIVSRWLFLGLSHDSLAVSCGRQCYRCTV